MPTNWCNAASLRKMQIEDGEDLTFCEVFVPYFVEKVSQLKPRKVLEIGAGTGHMAFKLSKYCGEILAVEPSLGMFQIAQEVLVGNSAINVKNISFEQMDRHSEFDLIYSQYKNAKDITKKRLYLESMESILQGMDKIIIDGKSNAGVVPYLPLNQLDSKNR